MILGCVALLLFGLVIQFASLSNNPPGFFIDESSVAFNAHKIATTGRDEHGEAWPLFFRAFGEFKNPVYIYLLAGIFRVTGPSIIVARALSAFAGLLTVLVLGHLAARITQRMTSGVLFAAFVLLTPWLFELSRLVIEVALYPIALALLLLSVWLAAQKPHWSMPDIVAIAATLALVTYTYSIGRLLGPLLALGLIIFVNRARLRGIMLTWIAFAATLVPMLIFNGHHPGALTTRFHVVTYVKPVSGWLQLGSDFLKHFLRNMNPWRMFISESSRVNELIHIPGAPAMLSITAVLLVMSAVLLIRLRQFTAWWCFVFYGLVVSFVPASLTIDDFHMFRLVAVPIFLLVLTIPVFGWFDRKRVVLVATMILIGIQGLLFQWQYQSSVSSPRRLHTFDADYPAKILPIALQEAGSDPIYLIDHPARPGYIQAFWYGTLQEIPLNRFVAASDSQRVPEGAIVITTEETCPRCTVVVQSDPYTTYVAKGPAQVLLDLSP